jgi:hypothetical protein
MSHCMDISYGGAAYHAAVGIGRKQEEPVNLWPSDFAVEPMRLVCRSL